MALVRLLSKSTILVKPNLDLISKLKFPLIMRCSKACAFFPQLEEAVIFHRIFLGGKRAALSK